MSNKESIGTPDIPNILNLISLAGKLNYTIDKTISIVYDKHPEIDKTLLRELLLTAGTDEYEAFAAGKDTGMYDVEAGMYHAASGGDADAHKALQSIQTGKVISEAIQNKFFPEDD